MSRIVEHSLRWIIENPYQSAIYGYAIRHAPLPTFKITLEIGKYGMAIAKPTAELGINTARIVMSHSPLIANSVRALRWGAPVAAGAVIGAVGGVAISTTIWGAEGNELSREFYSGKAENWYDYLPAYNGYKILRHYTTGGE
tara:strand:+ start:821 stop:1246 length:426 start_codon:yes stop_codon:yes gene_type:complete